MQAQILILVNIRLTHHYSALNINIHGTRNTNKVLRSKQILFKCTQLFQYCFYETVQFV